MKTKGLVLAGLVVVGLGFSQVVMAKMGCGGGAANGGCKMSKVSGEIPGLTPEQQKALENIGIEHKKKQIELHARMQTLHLELQQIVKENGGEKKIDAKIDEIIQVKGLMMKSKFAHARAIRGQLNADQQKVFDEQAMAGCCGGGGCGMKSSPHCDRKDGQAGHGAGQGPASCPKSSGCKSKM
jgi:hypothetical protein